MTVPGTLVYLGETPPSSSKGQVTCLFKFKYATDLNIKHIDLDTS